MIQTNGFIVLKLLDLHIDGFFIFICGIIINSIASNFNGLICLFVKKILLYGTITSNVNGARMQKLHISLFFLYLFFSKVLAIQKITGKGAGHLHSSLIFPPVHKHLYIYIEFWILDNHLLFSFAAHVISNFLLDEIYLQK